LDENGLPTSCVGDLPLVDPRPEVSPSLELTPPIAEVTPDPLIPPVDVYPSPLPLDPMPEMLANTGADVWQVVLVAVLLVAIGVIAFVFGREVSK
jgi:hypothetical protein